MVVIYRYLELENYKVLGFYIDNSSFSEISFKIK